MSRCGVDRTIAVQARQTLEETRWLLDLATAHPFIAGVIGWVDLQRRRVDAELELIASHPRLLGVRHVVQSEPDDRFLLRPAFRRGHGRRCALRPDVRPAGLCSTAAGGHRPRRAVSAASDSCSTTSGNPTSEVAAIRAGARTSRSWPPFRTSGASCRVWSPKQTGERGRRSRLRPYIETALECFGAGTADDRIRLACLHAGSRLHEDAGRRRGFPRRLLVEERASILGGTAQHLWNL